MTDPAIIHQAPSDSILAGLKAVTLAAPLVLLTLALVIFNLEYYRAPEFKWIGIAALAALCLISGAVQLLRQRGRFTIDAVDLYAMVFACYAALSLLWSADPGRGAYFLAKFALLWTVFTYFKHSTASNLRVLACWSITLAVVAAMLIQYFFPSTWGGFFNPNFMTEFLLLALPFMAGAAYSSKHRKVLWLPVAAVVLYVLFYLIWRNPSKIEFLVLPVAAMVSLLYFFRQRSRRAVAVGLFAILLIMAALVSLWWGSSNGFRDSLIPRLALDINTLAMWWERPLTGNGAGSFTALYPYFREQHLAFLPDFATLDQNKLMMVDAAHNEYLQFLAEFGLIGLAFVAALGIKLWSAIRKPAKIDAMTWIGIYASGFALVSATLEFPLQNPATGLLAAVALGFVAHGARPNLQPVQFGTGSLLKWGLVSGCFMLIGLAWVGAYRFDAAERENKLVAISYYYHDPETAFVHGMRAFQLNPLDANTRVQLFETLVQWNRVLGTPPLSPADYEKVFNYSLTAGPQPILLIRRLQFLLDTGLYKDKKAEVERWLTHLKRYSSSMADVWIADAFYAVLTNRQQDAMAAMAHARKLPLNREQKQQLLALQDKLSPQP